MKLAKRVAPIIICLALAFTLVACDNTTTPSDSSASGAGSASSASSGSSAGSVSGSSSSSSGQSQSSDSAAAVNSSSYSVSIVSWEPIKDAEDREALAVTFSFKNNTDAITYFSDAVFTTAKQNGIELEMAAVAKDVVDLSAISKAVKPGETLTVHWAFLLKNRSEVTVECTLLHDSNHPVLAKKSFQIQ
jgi:hypothetical protein